MSHIYESIAKYYYCMRYICSQIHSCNFSPIMFLLVQIVEVVVYTIGAADLVQW